MCLDMRSATQGTRWSGAGREGSACGRDGHDAGCRGDESRDSECGSDRICVDGETGLPDMGSSYSSTLNKGHRTWQALPFPNDKANWEI